MEIRVVRTDDSLTSRQLKERLETLPNWDDTIALEILQERGSHLRQVDQTVLVAAVSAIAATLGVLISGLLQIAQANYKERIVLVSKKGLRIEIETRHALKKLPELIELLKAMDTDRIEL
jgi:hypothetical protein